MVRRKRPTIRYSFPHANDKDFEHSNDRGGGQGTKINLHNDRKRLGIRESHHFIIVLLDRGIKIKSRKYISIVSETGQNSVIIVPSLPGYDVSSEILTFLADR